MIHWKIGFIELLTKFNQSRRLRAYLIRPLLSLNL
ncbi:hypothetical protein NTHI1209_01093 [Haemophilus influenzae]|uniref:Uncharacterized protein n=1 Tax=Haemophilus influenzae TaxID=727 RepID=A0A158SX92_HAEIF|nr:hypothetical protein NTHI1209_01093 [Haemophilus influenzae]